MSSNGVSVKDRFKQVYSRHRVHRRSTLLSLSNAAHAARRANSMPAGHGMSRSGTSGVRSASMGTKQLSSGDGDAPRHTIENDPNLAELAAKRDETNGFIPAHKKTVLQTVKTIALSNYANPLLVFVPVGIACHAVGVNPVVVFVMNFLAIIPLAALLSYATEEISIRIGETLGGLMNASFGNAVELIVGIIALLQDEITVLQASLLGSMLSNLLLVLGMCFIAGGSRYKEQSFNYTSAQMSASLLILSISSLLIPAAFSNSFDTAAEAEDGVLKISRGTSVILLVVYATYLVFQLKTHTYLYEEAEDEERDIAGVDREGNDIEMQQQRTTQPDGFESTLPTDEARLDNTTAATEGAVADEEEGGEVANITPIAAIILLICVTVLVAVCAEFLVSSIDALVEESGISRTWVGLILLPIVGNAAEHVTAVTVAYKNKMDLAIGVAVGSSLQIALLVTPFMCLLGWWTGHAMSLDFNTFEVVLLFVTVILVNYLIGDGKSNYLEGVLLCAVYVIIAVAVWFYPEVAR